MIGVVTAFGEEIKDYLKWGNFRVSKKTRPFVFYESRCLPHIVVVKGAIGKERAIKATEELIEHYKPERIISAGFSGGTKGEAQPGDIYLCDRVIAIEGPAALWGVAGVDGPLSASVPGIETTIGEDVENEGNTKTIRQGTCLSVPQLLTSSQMKRWAGSKFAANVIDMESYWVCETASQKDIPDMVVRVVFDHVEQNLPNFIGDSVREGEDQPVGKAIKHIIAKPKDTPNLIRMANQARLSRRSLSTFLSRLSHKVEQFDKSVEV